MNTAYYIDRIKPMPELCRPQSDELSILIELNFTFIPYSKWMLDAVQ